MTTDDGKAPPPSPARPLARWALATLTLDAVLVIALAGMPRAIVTESSVTTRAPVTNAIVTRDHAVFRRRNDSEQRLVVVSATGSARQLDFEWDGRGDVRCAMLARVEPRTPCPASATPSPARNARTMVAWRWSSAAWLPALSETNEMVGDAGAGDRSVRTTVDGFTLEGRVGFRVERPWVAFEGRRARIERDAWIERAVLVRGAQNEPRFIATPDGLRLALGDGVEERKRGLLSTLAGQLGELAFVALGAWIVAQIVALAAARQREGSSVFWQRFLRWSALLATFVTGSLTLGALRLAQG